MCCVCVHYIGNTQKVEPVLLQYLKTVIRFSEVISHMLDSKSSSHIIHFTFFLLVNINKNISNLHV